jgi:hypothetical protein
MIVKKPPHTKHTAIRITEDHQQMIYALRVPSPLVSTQTRSEAYSSVPKGALETTCLGQRAKLVSSVFTVLEGETSVVDIPR